MRVEIRGKAIHIEAIPPAEIRAELARRYGLRDVRVHERGVTLELRAPPDAHEIARMFGVAAAVTEWAPRVSRRNLPPPRIGERRPRQTKTIQRGKPA
jgi:hypothetical protein